MFLHVFFFLLESNYTNCQKLALSVYQMVDVSLSSTYVTREWQKHVTARSRQTYAVAEAIARRCVWTAERFASQFQIRISK